MKRDLGDEQRWTYFRECGVDKRGVLVGEFCRDEEHTVDMKDELGEEGALIGD